MPNSPFGFLGAGLALAILGATLAQAPANAATVSQREYKRGYNDCMNGRYDQEQHGTSYKKGCRAAENKMAKRKKKPVEECPYDVSEADRYKYPACQ